MLLPGKRKLQMVICILDKYGYGQISCGVFMWENGTLFFLIQPKSQFFLVSILEKAKEPGNIPQRRVRAPSLGETEEALAQAVWCWDGIARWVPH